MFYYIITTWAFTNISSQIETDYSYTFYNFHFDNKKGPAS